MREDGSDGEETIVAWEVNDPENPYNWSVGRKGWILMIAMVVIINSAMGSSLPSNAIPFIAAEWGVTSDQQKVLPMSVYLVGMYTPNTEDLGCALGTY